jgi:hypothetical protein
LSSQKTPAHHNQQPAKAPAQWGNSLTIHSSRRGHNRTPCNLQDVDRPAIRGSLPVALTPGPVRPARWRLGESYTPPREGSNPGVPSASSPAGPAPIPPSVTCPNDHVVASVTRAVSGAFRGRSGGVSPAFQRPPRRPEVTAPPSAP